MDADDPSADPSTRAQDRVAKRSGVAREQHSTRFAAGKIRSILGAASKCYQHSLATCHSPNSCIIEAMTKVDSTTVQRSYKFRCYSNSAQRQQLAVEFGYARWVWNTCFAWRSHLYQECNKNVTGTDFSRELTFLKRLGTYNWPKDASATCLTQKL